MSEPESERLRDELKDDAKFALWDLWDEAKFAVLVILVVGVPAAIGYAIADVDGLVAGFVVGLVVLGVFFLAGVVGILRDGWRWVRRRRG